MNENYYSEVSCPLCGCDKWEKYVMAPSHYGPELHQVTRCHDCGMVFTNPQVLSYEQQVENTGVLTRHLMPERLLSAELQARLQLALLGRYSEPGRLLDFGCGAGALVHAAIDQGWQATGLDLNRGLVNAANQHWGTNALNAGSLDDFLGGTEQHFDAIVSNQVFEHLRDPVDIGTKLVRRLNPGGVILIDVPNVNQPQEWFSRGKTLDPTSHWCHFSKISLTNLMERMGVKVVYANSSPALVNVYSRFLSVKWAVELGYWTKWCMPPVGTGVCVIGQKPK